MASVPPVSRDEGRAPSGSPEAVEANLDRRVVFASLRERMAGDVRIARRHSEGRIGPVLFPQLFAIFSHRVAHAAHQLGHPLLARFCSMIGQLLTGAEIEYQADLGPGVYLVHTSGIVIGAGTRTGSNIELSGGVVLGGLWASSSRPRSGFPVLGDDVELWAKASVIGPVQVGDGAIIGAHALVLKDVPAGAVARGVPATSYRDGQPV